MATPVFTLSENAGGMPMAVLAHPRSKASVQVHLQGAHVDGWVTGGGARPLYTSPSTAFKSGKAIRGGVPVCWPQFSDLGPCAAAHGFARTTMWEPLTSSDDADRDAASLTLRLTKSDDAPAPFQHMVVDYTVTLIGDGTLEMALSVTNPSTEPASFTTALHSYFAVSDIRTVRIEGVLDTCAYADNLEGRAMKPAAEIRTIAGEVDRIYHGTKGTEVRVVDGTTGATTTITASGLDDTVLWNPWIEKAARLADMPDDGFNRFVCVESAAVEKKVTVAPQQAWVGSQRVVFRAGQQPQQAKM